MATIKNQLDDDNFIIEKNRIMGQTKFFFLFILII